MKTTIADQYFLKALDKYDCEYNESFDALNYALAYDEEHVPSLCLMGRIMMERMKQPQKARHYFELALLYDVTYLDAYRYYSTLLIGMEEYDKAEKLMEKAIKNSCHLGEVYVYRMAIIYERRGQLDLALTEWEHGKKIATSIDAMNYIKQEYKRVKQKLKLFEIRETVEKPVPVSKFRKLFYAG